MFVLHLHSRIDSTRTHSSFAQHEALETDLEGARREIDSLSSQLEQSRQQSHDLERLLTEKESIVLETVNALVQEKEKVQAMLQEKKIQKRLREKLLQEKARLKDLENESTSAQGGLHAPTDEPQILQNELKSLEQLLKDQAAREQQQEIQRLQQRDAVREGLLVESEQRVKELRQAHQDLLKTLNQVKGQLQETKAKLESKDVQAVAAIQKKEMQIIEFLKAIESKTNKKDQELADTQKRLARTETALSKLMQAYQANNE
jgi:chromosome segregation ATPase